MVVYLDLIFIINLFFDFILLFGTKCILKLRTKFYRLFIGSLAGGLSIFLLFIKINSIELLILKLFISLLMVLITFGKKDFFRIFLYFYMISIFLGGGMYFLNNLFCIKHKGIVFINNGLSINFIVMIIISPFIIYYYVKEYLSYKNKINNYHKVDIFIKKKKYSLNGYLDTGNTLVDPYHNRGIVLLNVDSIGVNTKKYIYVPYKTITNSGVIKCYYVDKIVIDDIEFNNLLVGDIKNRFDTKYIDCLLPNKIKEDL